MWIQLQHLTDRIIRVCSIAGWPLQLLHIHMLQQDLHTMHRKCLWMSLDLATWRLLACGCRRVCKSIRPTNVYAISTLSALLAIFRRSGWEECYPVPATPSSSDDEINYVVSSCKFSEKSAGYWIHNTMYILSTWYRNFAKFVLSGHHVLWLSRLYCFQLWSMFWIDFTAHNISGTSTNDWRKRTRS